MAILQTSPVLFDISKDGKCFLYDIESGNKAEINTAGEVNLFFIDNKTVLFPSGTMDIYSGKKHKLDKKIDKIVDYLPKRKFMTAEINSVSTLNELETDVYTYYENYRDKVKYIICSDRAKSTIYKLGRNTAKLSLTDMKIDIEIDHSYGIFTAEDKYIIAPNKKLGCQIINVETGEITTFKFAEGTKIKPYLSGGLLVINKNIIKIWKFEIMSFIKTYKLFFEPLPRLIVKNNQEFYMFDIIGTDILFYNSSTDKTYMINYKNRQLSFDLVNRANEIDGPLRGIYIPRNTLYVGGNYIMTEMVESGNNIGILLLINFIEHTGMVIERQKIYSSIFLISKDIAIYQEGNMNPNYSLIRPSTGKCIKIQADYIVSVFPFRTDQQANGIYNVSMRLLGNADIISSNIKKVIAKFV